LIVVLWYAIALVKLDGTQWLLLIKLNCNEVEKLVKLYGTQWLLLIKLNCNEVEKLVRSQWLKHVRESAAPKPLGALGSGSTTYTLTHCAYTPTAHHMLP